jgi:integrase
VKHRKGVRRHGLGWQAFVRVNGDFYAKSFPLDTSPREMDLWRSEKRLRVLGRIAPTEIEGETFAHDAKRYLDSVTTMPTFKERKRDIGLWLTKLGRTRTRQSITSVEIRTVLEGWRRERSAVTCNHRRSALMHLWSVLDGKSAPNPVKDVPRYRDDSQDAPPRILSLPAIRALLKAMQPSKTKCRLELMAWTGWPPAQIRRLTPEDVDTVNHRVFLRPRRKGKGVGGRWLSVLPEGWAALKRFRQWEAWGHFSSSSMRQCTRRYAATLTKNKRVSQAIRQELANVTPYMLRHSFAVLVVLASKDERAAQHLLLHSDLRQTDRYTRAATDPRVAAALRAVVKLTKSASQRS